MPCSLPGNVRAYNRATSSENPQLPSLALSYYWLCLAMHKGKVKEGADFCQLAIDKEFYNGEHYLILARVWLIGRSRRRAVEALERGLALEPHNPALQKLAGELGRRRKPVIPFLSRNNPVNVALGRMRHGKANKPAKPRR